jgi:N-acyl-D-aspartate/D-glutamate deacylase
MFKRPPEAYDGACPFLRSRTTFREGRLSPLISEHSADDGRIRAVQYFERARFESHLEGDHRKFFANLRDPAAWAKIRAAALNPAGDREALVDLYTSEGVMPIGFKQLENQHYVGKRLSEIAAMRGQAWVDAARDLFLSEAQRISTIYFMMSEEHVRLQLQQPWTKISTDAGGMDPARARAKGPYHPRAYGTYPRVLGKYVRDEGVITLEDAVRKMSSAVADRLGLRDRGLLRVGACADVVVFDPTTISDKATFKDPHQLAVGVREYGSTACAPSPTTPTPAPRQGGSWAAGGGRDAARCVRTTPCAVQAAGVVGRPASVIGRPASGVRILHSAFCICPTPASVAPCPPRLRPSRRYSATPAG